MVSCASFGYPGFTPFGDSVATYSFGTPTGTAIGSTLTETITFGSRTETITYTEVTAATATSAAQFEILPASASGNAYFSSASSYTPPTYAFEENASGTTNVVETITRGGSTETLTYSGGTTLTDDLVTITTPSTSIGHSATLSYDFTSSGSTVTITETLTSGSTTTSHTVTPDPTTVFAATTSNGTPEETLTFAQGNAVVTQTYIQVASGSYALASTDTAYVAQGSATTALDVQTGDRAEITIGTSSTTITPVNALGTAGKSFTTSSDASFAVVTPTSAAGLPATGSFVEETVTFGSHTSEVLFYSATGTSGIYTEVAHGSSIDVTGIATQLASLPSGVVALL